MASVTFNDYELEVISETLNDALFRTGVGFENSDLTENPDTAARVATMYVIVAKIKRELGYE